MYVVGVVRGVIIDAIYPIIMRDIHTIYSLLEIAGVDNPLKLDCLSYSPKALQMLLHEHLLQYP